MNRQTLRQGFIAAAASLLLAAIPSGCSDDSPDTSQLDNYFASHPYVSDPRSGGTAVVGLSPESATIDAIGGSQLFTASGGSGGYTWDTTDHGVGTMTPKGSQAIYTALAIGDNYVVVSDAKGNAAIAHVSGTPAAAMTISPGSATLSSDGQLQVFAVSGGVAPYSWTMTSSSVGLFPDGNTGSSVVYMRTHTGNNALTVTDGSGNSAHVVVSQP